MKTIMLGIFICLSLQATAGTIVNKKTGESIELNCIEKIHGKCEIYETSIKLNNEPEINRDFDLRTLQDQKDFKRYVNSKLYVVSFEGIGVYTMVGAVGPIALADDFNSNLAIIPALAITPVTIAIGLTADIIHTPVLVTNNAVMAIKNKKIKKLNKVLQSNETKRVNNRRFKLFLKSKKYLVRP